MEVPSQKYGPTTKRLGADNRLTVTVRFLDILKKL